MATYTVTTLSEGTTQGTLRHAISSIPANSTEEYVITFDDSLEGDISLTSRLYRSVTAGRDNVFIDAFKSDGTPRFIGIKNDEDSSLDGRVILLLFRNISCRFRGIVFNGGYDTATTSAGGVSIEATSSYSGQVDAVFESCVFFSCYDTSNGACYVKHNATYNNCLFYGCYCGQTGSNYRGLVNTDDGEVTFNDCTLVNNTLASDPSIIVGVKSGSTATVEMNNTIVTTTDEETAQFAACPVPYDVDEHAANPDLPRADESSLRLYPLSFGRYAVGTRVNATDIVARESAWPIAPMGCYNVYGASTDIATETYADYLENNTVDVPALSVLSYRPIEFTDWNGSIVKLDSLANTGEGLVLVDSDEAIELDGYAGIATFGETTLSRCEFADNTDTSATVEFENGLPPCWYSTDGENWKPLHAVAEVPVTPDTSCFIRYSNGYYLSEKQAKRVYYYVGDATEGSFIEKSDWSLTDGGEPLGTYPPTIKNNTFNVKL